MCHRKAAMRAARCCGYVTTWHTSWYHPWYVPDWWFLQLYLRCWIPWWSVWREKKSLVPQELMILSIVNVVSPFWIVRPFTLCLGLERYLDLYPDRLVFDTMQNPDKRARVSTTHGHLQTLTTGVSSLWSKTLGRMIRHNLKKEFDHVQCATSIQIKCWGEVNL